MSEATVRCFVALMIDGGTREAIAAGILPLQRSTSGVKWVEPRNMHFTLKFLGEIDPDRVDSARRGVERAVKGSPRFDMVLGGLGTFPGGRSPRVVWIGLRQGGDSLSELASRVENELVREGFPAEKRGFTPHLTIGRVRDPGRTPGLLESVASVRGIEAGPSPASLVCLMQSTLTPEGPIYTPVASWELS